MSEPKLHHYVPRFYLGRFTDASGYLWIWDRDQDRIFRTKPNRVAAEKDFIVRTEVKKIEKLRNSTQLPLTATWRRAGDLARAPTR